MCKNLNTWAPYRPSATMGKCLKPDGTQFCWCHSQFVEELLRVGYPEQEACHVLDFSSLSTLCRPLWTSSLNYKYSHIQISCYNQHHVCFPKILLGVNRSMKGHCLLRETGQLPPYFYLFHCVARFWNSLLTTNIALRSKINEADLQLAHREGSWTFEILSALREAPGADVHISAIMSRSKMNMSELLLRELTIWEWRDSGPCSSTSCACFQQSHKTFHTPGPFWGAHRESDWLVGRLETRNQTNSAFIPTTQ